MYFLGQIVALKKLKMEKEREGFPITSLREINMLLKSEHPNIVHVRVSKILNVLYSCTCTCSEHIHVHVHVHVYVHVVYMWMYMYMYM